MPDIFISYSAKDKPLAEKIYNLLNGNGYEVWWDVNEILVGHDITDRVYKGLMKSRFLTIILTKNSVKSKWVAQELNFARTREIEKGGVAILPLRFDDCEVPGSISTKRWADFRKSFSLGAEELLKALSTYSNQNELPSTETTAIKVEGIPVSTFPIYPYPSVFIGVGGFGTRVMAHAKKKLEAGTGNSDLPILKSMVLIDSNQNFLLEGISGNVTRLPTDLPYNFLSNILKDPLRFQHISLWLPKEFKMILNNVVMGCAMIRAIGRLRLFNNISEIKNQIKKSVNSISDLSSSVQMFETYGIKTSLDTLYFYLIASTCGGTGSGQVIDLAYLIRSLYPDAKIIAYLGLPEAFPNIWSYANPRLFSNTFAFLKELEYFNKMQEFQVSWDGEEEFRFTTHPFDNTYLFSAINEKGITFGFDQLFEKITGHLLLAMDRSYSGEYWRSKSLNKEPILSGFVENPDGKRWSCRYSAFGISGIEGNLTTKYILQHTELLARFVPDAFPLVRFIPSNSKTGIRDGLLKYGLLTPENEIYDRHKVIKIIEDLSGIPITAVESDPIGLLFNIERVGFPLFELEFLNKYRQLYRDEMSRKSGLGKSLHIFENAESWEDLPKVN